LTTRPDDLEGFAVLTIFEFLAVFCKALGIIQVPPLSAAQDGALTLPTHDDLLARL
jgi:hypothetical protein